MCLALVSAGPHKILPRSAEDKALGGYAELTIFKVTACTLCYKFLLDFYSDPSVRRINRRCLDAARLTPRATASLFPEFSGVFYNYYVLYIYIVFIDDD